MTPRPYLHRLFLMIFASSSVLACSVDTAKTTNQASFASTAESPETIAAAMLKITKNAHSKLSTLSVVSSRAPSSDALFAQVTETTNSHAKALGLLGEHFNALDSSVRAAFIDSAAGRLHTKQMNDELAQLKALATDLIRNVPHVEVDLGRKVSPERVPGLLNPTQCSDDTPKHIEGKVAFLRVMLMGVRGWDESKQREAVTLLESLRAGALRGDATSVSKINVALAGAFDDYPKDGPGYQYNIGLLYRDLGCFAEARSWLTMSASQGLKQAKAALKELDLAGRH